MLPDKLFYTTQIPACIWIFNKNKKTDEVLFIDSSELGTLVEGSKKNKEFKDEVIKKITNIFEEFEKNNSINEKGFAKSVKLSEIEEKDFSLLPGSYIEIKEDFKRTEEEIKNELKENLDKLNSMLEDSKELEEKLKIAILKMNL
jgi:type I restriction enzyme M protein